MGAFRGGAERCPVHPPQLQLPVWAGAQGGGRPHRPPLLLQAARCPPVPVGPSAQRSRAHACMHHCAYHARASCNKQRSGLFLSSWGFLACVCAYTNASASPSRNTPVVADQLQSAHTPLHSCVLPTCFGGSIPHQQVKQSSEVRVTINLLSRHLMPAEVSLRMLDASFKLASWGMSASG